MSARVAHISSRRCVIKLASILVLVGIVMQPLRGEGQLTGHSQESEKELTCCSSVVTCHDQNEPAAPCPCRKDCPACPCIACPCLLQCVQPAVLAALRPAEAAFSPAFDFSSSTLRRNEKPPLPPPKQPHHFHPVGSPPTSVQTKHSNLHIYENTIPDSRGYRRLHYSASLRAQHELLRQGRLL